VFVWLAEETPAPHTQVGQRPSAEKMFATPMLWFFFIATCLAFSLRDFAGGGMASLGSLFLQQAHHLDPEQTGLALSGIYLASAVSNPLFGRLSDHGRIRWTCLVLVAAAVMIALFPHVPKAGLIPMFISYGFFFMASYPVTEAAVIESVHDSVRGRVYGLFITVGGLVGNLAHWQMGFWVERLGTGARSASRYYPLYGVLALLVILSLAGLPCLHAIRRREVRLGQEALTMPTLAGRVGPG
jgi:MFS family permease